MPLRSIVASRTPSVASTVGSRRVASRTHDEPVFARYSSFHSAIARLLAVPTTPVRDVTRSPSVGVVIVAIGGATAPTAMLTTAGADVYVPSVTRYENRSTPVNPMTGANVSAPSAATVTAPWLGSVKSSAVIASPSPSKSFVSTPGAATARG